RLNVRGRLAGRILSLDVLPTRVGPDAWPEVLFTLSHHPGTGSRPTGQITLLYRLRTDVASKATSSQGLTGIVDVPVTAGTWQTVAFDLLGDLAAIWSDVDPRDNSLNQLDFRASSRRQAPAEFFFGYLRFTDQVGYDALGVETDLMARYAAEVPGVLGLVGTEISLGPHVNQFGGTQKPYDYQVTSLKQAVTADYRSMSDFIHANGGLASINHPFKAGDLGGDVTARSVATNLLAVNAGGADILEVGYLARHGAVLADYVAVWDALSRNGLFLTANGVSDDHTGQNWATQKNRFYTAAWSTALHEDALVAALASGRSYVGYLGGFAGTVDMTLDDDLPMGAVAVNALGAHTMHLRVTGVPSGGSVQILQGHLDYAGTSDPTPNTQVVKTIGGTDLGPSVDVPLTADDASFFRVQVVDRSGAVVALGQPTWLLDQARTPVPAARQSQAGTGTTTG
ncbi:MAG: hypothetical protein ACXVXE_17905, partial [Nocardioidaceae bacterium]